MGIQSFKLLAMTCMVSVALFVLSHDTHSSEIKEKARPKIDIPQLERNVHDLINIERKKQGLRPLGWNGKLNAIARRHSRDMAERDYFSHYSPEGNDFLYRYEKAGFKCSIRTGNVINLGAENIFQISLYDSITYINGAASYDWYTPAEIADKIVSEWTKSPGHRKNILTPFWKTEGIGISISDDLNVFVTQNFC